MNKADTELKRIQDELLALMKQVHAFCEAHDIPYSLTGGSLLGAVRHQGFIPWDDDLDIMLTRDSFEKFKVCFRENGMEQCVFEIDQWVYRVRREHRVQGYLPSIDFFVVDYACRNRLRRKWQSLRLKVLQGLLRTNEKEGKYSWKYRILIGISSLIGKFVSKEKAFEAYDRISQWGAKAPGSEVSILNDRFKLIGLRYDRSLMEHYESHAFEDTSFQIISNYKDYLTRQFGDYMQLPPEEERVPQHIF